MKHDVAHFRQAIDEQCRAGLQAEVEAVVVVVVAVVAASST